MILVRFQGIVVSLILALIPRNILFNEEHLTGHFYPLSKIMKISFILTKY